MRSSGLRGKQQPDKQKLMILICSLSMVLWSSSICLKLKLHTSNAIRKILSNQNQTLKLSSALATHSLVWRIKSKSIKRRRMMTSWPVDGQSPDGVTRM